MYRPAERPVGVTLIAFLLALNGIVALLGAIGVFGPTPGGTVGLILGLLFGLALLYLAYGLWTLQPWAWLTTLLIQGINAVFALITAFAAPGAITAWISLVLAAVIIFYLTRSEVREAFGQRTNGI